MDANALPERRRPAGRRRPVSRPGRARLARVLLLPIIALIWLAAGAVRLVRAAARPARRAAALIARQAAWGLAAALAGAFVAGAATGAWLGFRLAPAPEAAAESDAGVPAGYPGPTLPEAAAMSGATSDAAAGAEASATAATADEPAAAPTPAETATAPTTATEAPAGAASGPPEAAPAASAAAEPAVPPAPGSLTWPVRGEVLTPFGWVYSRVHGDWRFHPGIDIRSAPDMPFVAALDGTVADVRHTAGDGYTLVLSHGRGVETLYAGLRAVTVRPGERVRPGQEVGRVGPGPAAEAGVGAHLHLEVRVGGEAVDPVPLLPAN